MIELKLSQTEKYKKFQAVRKAGYDVVNENSKYILVDKQSNADDYIETTFRSIDEILTVLAGYLLKVGIMVTL
jgi:hypothetical protein